MAKFFDNVSWQKVVLVLGGFVLLVATAVLFPEAYATVFGSIAGLIGSIIQGFRDFGGNP